MKFTVTRIPSAVDQLAEVWNLGPDRAEIEDAANRIDQVLSRDAHLKGESGEGDLRILVCMPLAVDFVASPDDRMATVHSVWRFRL